MLAIGLLLVGLLTSLQQTSSLPADLTRSDRVRPLDDQSRRLVVAGARQSPTFGALLDALDRCDVVVYVAVGPDLRSRGALTFVAHAGSLTYVLVRVQPMLVPAERLSSLAHELQHAVEVAEAPFVIENDQALAELYRRIGFPVRRGAFESARAQMIEARVRRELKLALQAF